MPCGNFYFRFPTDKFTVWNIFIVSIIFNITGIDSLSNEQTYTIEPSNWPEKRERKERKRAKKTDKGVVSNKKKREERNEVNREKI